MQDEQGHTAPSAAFPISVQINSTLAALGGTLTRVPVNGIARFGDLTIDKVGDYRLSFSSPTLTGVTTTPFVLVPGSPQSLAFTLDPPAVAIAGFPIDPGARVSVLDRNHNVVTASTLPITVALSDLSGASTALAGTLVRNAVNGVAWFDDLTVDAIGAGYSLLATAPSLTSATSGRLSIRALPQNFSLQSISVGLDQTCGLTGAGSAYCWGANGFGQLGDGSTLDHAGPVPVTGGLRFTALSAGGGGYEEDVSFTCGITDIGEAWCWGGSFRGALGDGTTVGSHNTPVRVVGDLRFKSISAGGAHVCGLTIDDLAYCWGSNDAGELGIGTTSQSTTPALVAGGLHFTNISAGDFHTCAGTGTATYCWGSNISSGFGSTGITPVPKLVTSAIQFPVIATGTDHTCGLTSIGSAYCWGDNSSGELGTGSGVFSPGPALVVGGRAFTSMSTKGYTGCGISAGSGYCWGWNDLGQLGVGFFTPRPGPQQGTPLRVLGSSTFSGISVGVWHTCALSTSGIPYCWGLNDHGQLGNETRINSTVPVPVLP